MPPPDQTAAKQQIVERLKQANNILVTVSNNPSVDQLAACIGLTLLLNRMGKHATAVYSGATPSTIEFLQPEKTLEANTDSLQDFIISLDKAKADKLRYKVEDQVVKIFITPYRTKITEGDLVFSHGDFNVEAVLALGVKDRTQIDAAIAAHGRILHDATVVALSAGKDATDLGQINWQDPAASSLSEMVVSISEAFGSGLIDNQMATAFLTGIVAETDRFSNTKTSPKVMTMSAQLMAAGANQQLISAKLEAPPPPPTIAQAPPTPPKEGEGDGTLVIPHKEAEPVTRGPGLKATPVPTLPIRQALPTGRQAQGKPADEELPLDSDGSQIIIDEQGNLQTGPLPAPAPAKEPPEVPAPKPVEPPTPFVPEPEPPLPAEPSPARTPPEFQAGKPELPAPPSPAPVATKPSSETSRLSAEAEIGEATRRSTAGKPPLPYKPPETGGHDLLQPRPDHQQEDLGGPFTAGVQPAWAAYEDLDTAIDPLGQRTDSGQPDTSGPDLATKARDNIKSALDAAPFVPDLHPEERLGAKGTLDIQPEMASPTNPPLAEQAGKPVDSSLGLPPATQAHEDKSTPVLPLPTNDQPPPAAHPAIPKPPVPQIPRTPADQPTPAPPGPPPFMVPPKPPSSQS